MYRCVLLAPPEPLPFANESFKTVFLYFPHGLVEVGKRVDYPRVLEEIRRVIRPDGTLLMTGINDVIERYFVCHPLQKFCERRGWTGLAAYFKNLDARRYEELSGLGHSLHEWRKLLKDAGFCLEETWSQVRPLGWMLYDIQTRPFEKMLARASKALRRIGVKTAIKAPCLYAMLPLLGLFYLMWIKPRRVAPNQADVTDIFFAFRASVSKSLRS